MWSIIFCQEGRLNTAELAACTWSIHKTHVTFVLRSHYSEWGFLCPLLATFASWFPSRRRIPFCVLMPEIRLVPHMRILISVGWATFSHCYGHDFFIGDFFLYCIVLFFSVWFVVVHILPWAAAFCLFLRRSLEIISSFWSWLQFRFEHSCVGKYNLFYLFLAETYI